MSVLGTLHRATASSGAFERLKPGPKCLPRRCVAWPSWEDSETPRFALRPPLHRILRPEIDNLSLAGRSKPSKPPTRHLSLLNIEEAL